jgi:hypothetical protein
MFLISNMEGVAIPARHEQEKPCPITKELWRPDLPMLLLPYHFPSLDNVSITHAFSAIHWKWWLELVESRSHWTEFLASGRQEYTFIKRPIMNDLIETLGTKLLAFHGT